MNTAGVTAQKVSTHIGVFRGALSHMADVAGNFVMRQINTLIKALTSMIGVMTMFTLFITVPEMLVKGFMALTKTAMEAADALILNKITIQSLIASVMDFGDTAEKSFNKAAAWADHVYLKFVRMSAESILTVDQMLTGYQAFLAGGGAQFTKSLDDQVKLSALLSQTIVTLTGKMGGARQQFSEMRALLAGDNIAGAQLVKWLANTEEVIKAGGIKKYIKDLKEGKTGLEEFTKLLGVFNEAAKKQGLTFTGLTTAIGDYINTLNTAALQGAGLQLVQGFLIGIRDTLDKAILELTDADKKTKGLSESTLLVVDAFVRVNAMLQTLIIYVTKALGLFIDLSTPAKTLQSTSENIVVIIATIVGYVQSLSTVFFIAKNSLGNIMDLLHTAEVLMLLIVAITEKWVNILNKDLRAGHDKIIGTLTQELNTLVERFGDRSLDMYITMKPGFSPEIGRASCRERVCQYV
jgi:hypothetical protein